MATSPKKPKAEFTKAETRKFIQLYTSHDVLWNASNQHYTKKDKRAQALQEIATFFPEKALTSKLTSSLCRHLKQPATKRKRFVMCICHVSLLIVLIGKERYITCWLTFDIFKVHYAY